MIKAGFKTGLFVKRIIIKGAKSLAKYILGLEKKYCQAL